MGVKGRDINAKRVGRTFSARAGTALEGLRKPEEDFIRLLTRYLPMALQLQAIVHAFN